MTSQKSLKNNVNANDFKRSLLGSILFPAIALVVLFMLVVSPVISYVTSESFLTQKVHTEVSMFINGEIEYTFGIIPAGMICCGILTAIKSFYFLLSKKQTNVYLSLGVKRQTLFFNRTLSAVICLFVAVLIPMLTLFIVNVKSFGASTHVTELFLYTTSLLFVNGIVGFALGSFAMMISGNVFEAVLTTGSATVLPLIIAYTIDMMGDAFINGHRGVTSTALGNWIPTLTPWGMTQSVFPNYTENFYGDSQKVDVAQLLIALNRNTTPDKYKVPEEMQVDLGFTLPIIIWAVLSVVILALALVLFNRRKAEHANSFGHFAISRHINSTLLFVGALYCFTGIITFELGPVPYFIIAVLVGAILFFLCQLIMTRKLKITLKSFRYYAFVVGVFTLCLVATATGYFGAYNKTPAKEDVKSVALELTALSPYEHFINSWNEADEDFVESTNQKDINTVLALFDKIKEQKIQYGDDSIDFVTFAIRKNNDEVMYRTFNVYDVQVAYDFYKTAYNSNYFDEILKEYLINDPPQSDLTDDGVVYDEYGFPINVDDSNESAGWLKRTSWTWLNSNLMLNIDENVSPLTTPIENNEELCRALYNDLTKFTYDQFFHNDSQPIGVLAVYDNYLLMFDSNKKIEPRSEDEYYWVDSGEAVYVSDHAMISRYIPVYAEMTETLKFLKDNDIELHSVDAQIKEVLYTDSTLRSWSAFYKFAMANKNDYKGWGEVEDMYIEGVGTGIFDGANQFNFSSVDEICYFITEDITGLDALKRIYKDAGHPLASVTDKAKMEEIANSSVSQYFILENAGRFVYIVYDNGAVVCRYLPEANLDVLK